MTGPAAVLRRAGRHAWRGLLLGALTWAYTLVAFLLTEHALMPVSGCEELSCLALYVVPVMTVPVVVAGLVCVLQVRRPVLTWVLFLGSLVLLVRAGALYRSGVTALSLMASAGALAAAVAGLCPRVRVPSAPGRGRRRPPRR